jgi:hypothetical protein
MKIKETYVRAGCGHFFRSNLVIICLIFFAACGQDRFKEAIDGETGKTPPSPGNSGVISASYTDSTVFDVRWQSASDETTSPGKLQYRVFASSNVFSSYEDALDVADELTMGWTLGISSIQTRIVSGTMYNWCNVYVRDDNGNIAAYNGVIPTPYANTPPVVGGGGNISISGSFPLGTALTWAKGSDLQTPVTSLRYRVYYGTTDTSVGTFANATAPGNTQVTPDWVYDISSIQADFVSGGVYWVNVFVMDGGGLISAYAPIQVTVSPKTPPVVNGYLPFSALQSTITVNWTEATDPDGETPQNQLQYRVFCSTSASALNGATPPATGASVWEITTGWTTDWTNSGTLSLTASGLNQGTTYYFNVYVRDLDQMISAYGVTWYNTTTILLPTPGNGGALTLKRNRDSVNISWTGATSTSATIQYRVYRSSSNNIATYEQAETNHNGIEITNGWTSAITQIDANALPKNTTWYFNVFVTDSNGGIAAYVTNNMVLPPNSAPVLPVSGVTSLLNTNFTATLSWPKATDDYTQQEFLQYRIFYSTTNIGNTYSNYVDGSDVAIVPEVTLGWTSDIETAVTPVLSRNTTYYIKVFVRDFEGLISPYSVHQRNVPVSNCVPGNGGHIDLLLNGSTWNLVWTAAKDDLTPPASLQYRVFCSTSSTVLIPDAIPSGADVYELTYGWTSDLVRIPVTLVFPGDPTAGVFYYNVYVRNADGNIKAYSQYTYNNAFPIPGNGGTITAEQQGSKKIGLSWTKATDGQTAQSSLVYCVYSSEVDPTGTYSALNNVTTYANAVAAASGISPTAKLETTGGWITDIDELVCKMNKNSTYYFNVFVRDSDGNISAYKPVQQSSPD